LKFLLTLSVLLVLASCNRDKKGAITTTAPNDTILGKVPAGINDTLYAKLPAPFNTLDFDRAVAYDYDGTYDGLPIIDKAGKLSGSVINEKQLTDSEIAVFLGTLGNPHTYGNGVSDCFAPRMGLVLYKGKAVVFHASICFACNQLESSMVIPAMVQPRKDAKTGKERFGGGFSDAGKEQLTAFCASLKFSHCAEYP
jgi:hypothetical protein